MQSRSGHAVVTQWSRSLQDMSESNPRVSMPQNSPGSAQAHLHVGLRILSEVLTFASASSRVPS